MNLEKVGVANDLNSSLTAINTASSFSENNTESMKKTDGGEQENKNFSKQAKNLIESANKEVKLYNKSIKFSIHEETNKIMVKIIDNQTDEVIKEIPSEKILDMVAKLCEMVGILVDEKA